MAELVEKTPVAQSARADAPRRSSGKRPNISPGDISRWTVFSHALAFVIGFGTIFTISGAALGLIGQSLTQYMPTIARFGAVLLFLFGLTTLGVFRWLAGIIRTSTDLNHNPAAAALVSICEFFNRVLYTEKRVTEMHNVNRSWGYLSSALMGVSFSAGWIPCVGPILSSIWFLAQYQNPQQGALLLAIYSLGLGIPFLITGLAFGSTTRLLRRLNRHAGIVSIVSALFLFYVAALLWTDQLGSLAGNFAFLTEWVALIEENMTVTLGSDSVIGLSMISAAPLAFLAGLISFISPCVLPLVPAYIGYLSGASLGGSLS